MKRCLASLLLLTALTSLAAKQPTPSLKYPAAPQSKQTDVYHGMEVGDPFRPLENAEAPETRQWIEAENKLTQKYLEDIPEREAIHQRLTKLWDYEKWGVPTREGGRYFYTRNSGLQNQSVLFVAPQLPGEARELLDPNKLSQDGTVALGGIDISHDGKRMVYSLSTAGSDWQELRVRDIETGKDLPDVIKWVKFADGSWKPDGSGFFYSRYAEPKGEELKTANFNHKLYFHRLGTPQSEDALIYERPDHANWIFQGKVTEDGAYLVIHVAEGTESKNRIFYLPLADPKAKVVELLNKQDAQYDFLGNDGSVFWFRTNRDAPLGRIIAIDLRQPEEMRVLVPETKDKLESASVVGDRFILHYLQDAHSLVRLHELNGKPAGEIALPGLGSASGFTGRRTDRETFYEYVSFIEPRTIFRYDLEKGRSEVLFRPQVDFKTDDYTTEQVFYRSKDGTKIPMFITYKKGLKKDGSNPTILYGYGGFDLSQLPEFKPQFAAWMQMGGVYALATLRGGGEYGEAWHQAGMKLKKQNVFDDFIAAGEWLIANKYTSTPKLAIHGRSNGGLLVGACLTQRPDLWGATLPTVGVMDMLRFPLFTIGWAWKSDYGSPDEPAEFAALHKYSPLHNVRPGTKYPPTLITTGDHDDRVFPGHSFKFAAALQAAQAGPAPILIRIDTRAGHGSGKPTSKLIDEVTDQLAFLVKSLGMKVAF